MSTSVVVTLATWLVVAAVGQDVSDCEWSPTTSRHNLELNCHLKTLQTGPEVIPEVGGLLLLLSIIGLVNKVDKLPGHYTFYSYQNLYIW